MRPQADQLGHDLGKMVNKVGGVCFCTCSPTWFWVLTSTPPSWNSYCCPVTVSPCPHASHWSSPNRAPVCHLPCSLSLQFQLGGGSSLAKTISPSKMALPQADWVLAAGLSDHNQLDRHRFMNSMCHSIASERHPPSPTRAREIASNLPL